MTWGFTLTREFQSPDIGVGSTVTMLCHVRDDRIGEIGAYPYRFNDVIQLTLLFERVPTGYRWRTVFGPLEFAAARSAALHRGEPTRYIPLVCYQDGLGHVILTRGGRYWENPGFEVSINLTDGRVGDAPDLARECPADAFCYAVTVMRATGQENPDYVYWGINIRGTAYIPHS